MKLNLIDSFSKNTKFYENLSRVRWVVPC